MKYRVWKLGILLVVVAAGLCSTPVPAQESTFTGEVVAVSDGDTMRILRNGVEVKVRLFGADAPEKAQKYGPEAREFTQAKVLHKTVTVKVMKVDQYQRLVSDVIAPDGVSLNVSLLRNGYAWWYHQYAPSLQLANAETEARKARRGLWDQSNPTPPWVFRNGVS